MVFSVFNKITEVNCPFLYFWKILPPLPHKSVVCLVHDCIQAMGPVDNLIWQGQTRLSPCLFQGQPITSYQAFRASEAVVGEQLSKG